MTDTTDLLRREVAACSRLLVDVGILGYSGHVSARIADSDQFVIQRVDDVRAQLTPERLLTVDRTGKNVGGDSGRPPAEVFIHSEIYRARPEVGAVAHFHHDPTTVFSVVEGLQIALVKNHAARWMNGIPVHFDSSHIATPRQGAEVATTLASGHALLLRSHGEVVVAEGVKHLYADVIHFVENAHALALACQLGRVLPLSNEELTSFLATFNRDKHAAKLWKYYTSIAVSRGLIPAEWLPQRDASDQPDPIQ